MLKLPISVKLQEKSLLTLKYLYIYISHSSSGPTFDNIYALIVLLLNKNKRNTSLSSETTRRQLSASVKNTSHEHPQYHI